MKKACLVHERLLVNGCKENLVLQIERGNLWKMKTIASWKITIERGKPVEASSHKVQEVGSLEHRDDANKFNLAIDDENIDFNISGVPNAMVKRSHSINVHNLIQQIENHSQRQALQSDLEQHRPFNPFSAESKVAIMAAGNTELCEIVDVEPKSQCRACLSYWSAGIVYCTCGHLMKDDTTENKKYISSVLDLFSIPNFYIKKGPATRSQVREETWLQRIPHGKSTSKEMPQEEIWQHSRSIHPRQVLRKNDDRVGSLWRDHPWDGSACKRRSQPYCHRRRIDVYRGNWWIRSNVVNFDTMPTRRQPDFKKALSTLHRLKKAEDKKQYEKWSQSSSSWWQWQTTWWHPYYENSPQRWSEHWLNGETCVLSEPTIHLWHESQQEFDAQFIGNSQRSLLSPTGGVKRTSPDTANHERKWLRKSVWRQQHLQDQCGQWQQWHDVHQYAQHVGLSTPARSLVFLVLVTRVTPTVAQVVLESFTFIHMSSMCGCPWLSSTSPFYFHPHFLVFFLSFLSMYSVTNNLRDSAKGSFVTYDDIFPLTGSKKWSWLIQWMNWELRNLFVAFQCRILK